MGRTTQFFAKAPGGPSKCSAWGQMALDFLQIHHFRTAKTVQIKDWRLGSLYWSAVTLIWAYVGWSLFLSRTYMESVPAVGTHMHWGGNWQASDLRWSAAGKCDADCGTAGTYESASSLMYGWLNSSATGSFAYCNNSNYDFVWSPEFGYGPYFCTFQPFEELWTKMTEGLFFTTSMSSTKSKCFDVSGGVHTSDACDTAFAAANLSCAAGSYYRVGTCCCDEVAYTFPVAAEHMSMEFEHGFSSSYAQHIPSGKAYLPRIIFRLKSCIEKKLGSCDILEVPQGILVTLPLQALFKLLAIDLDDESCTQNGGKATDFVDGKC
ncbi:unnamed protein product [Polarella glacialis]|uniref:Uncharacterized protein n=1 Tax=Polarella glacialis TaxID=89957 RepID=A0A813LSQ7_POLGL|nr:unnamed protein product [Polarella glacialis]